MALLVGPERLRPGVDFRIRPLGPEDMPFVASTWLRDYGEKSAFARKIAPQDYHLFHKLVIARLLERSKTLIVADPKDDGLLFGFLCCEPPTILHYAYIKRPFRGLGLGAALYAESGLVEPVTFTHLTYTGESVWKTCQPAAKYVPYHI